MTDKETLILAAKAAGYTNCEYVTELNCIVHDEGVFNSFISNEECFRLETALNIDIQYDYYNHDVCAAPNSKYQHYEFYADHNGDKDKARRYASTRAAALIGRE